MATATYDMTTATFPAAISGSGLSASDITSSGNLAVFQQGLRSGNYVLQAANNSTTTADVARTNNRYATLTLTGTGQTITSIVVDAMKGGSTVRGFALATSDDSFATFLLQDDDINTVQPTLTTYSATGLSIALSGTVEVRIYPYSASNGQTSEFDNIVITTAANSGTTHTVTAGTMVLSGQTVASNGKNLIPVSSGTVIYTGQTVGTNSKTNSSITASVIDYTTQTVITNAKKLINVINGSVSYTGQAVSSSTGTTHAITAASLNYAAQVIASTMSTIVGITAATVNYLGRTISTGAESVRSAATRLAIALGFGP